MVRQEARVTRRGLADGATVPASLTGFTDTQLRSGTEYCYRIVASYRSADGQRRHAIGAVVRAVPEPAPQPVTDLEITEPDDDGPPLLARWTAPAYGQVRLVRSDQPLRWPAGAPDQPGRSRRADEIPGLSALRHRRTRRYGAAAAARTPPRDPVDHRAQQRRGRPHRGRVAGGAGRRPARRAEAGRDRGSAGSGPAVRPTRWCAGPAASGAAPAGPTKTRAARSSPSARPRRWSRSARCTRCKGGRSSPAPPGAWSGPARSRSATSSARQHGDRDASTLRVHGRAGGPLLPAAGRACAAPRPTRPEHAYDGEIVDRHPPQDIAPGRAGVVHGDRGRGAARAGPLRRPGGGTGPGVRHRALPAARRPGRDR